MRVALVLLLACAAACRTGVLPASPPSSSSDGAVDFARAAPTVDLALSVSIDMSMRPRPCGADECQGGDLCQSAEGCCSCGIFGGYCLPSIWTCAWPAENDTRCPPNEPVSGDACSVPSSVRCWYCGADGPRSAQCGYCADPNKAACWTVAGRGGHCD